MMLILGCTLNGDLNESKFSQPLPWIGVYVALASATCALAMAADAFSNFRQRKLWFPCKYFSLNATTLAFITIAVKFSADLNTSMPHKQDQLAKLSSSAFICTVMGNSLPSIGTMKNKEMMMNIMALGILIVTLIVNICIQLDTGVIYTFWKEHVFLMFLMLFLLAITCSSALTVPITKCYLDKLYTKKHEIATKECSHHNGESITKKLRRDLSKFWMMAYSCEPQFVIGRSATGAASGAICILSATILGEAMMRSFFVRRKFKFCNGESDYKWSTTLVLLTQIVAVILGTIGPTFRWFAAISFRCPEKGINVFKKNLIVESYWIQILVELKETPIQFRFGGPRGKRLVLGARELFVVSCIRFQIGIVAVCKTLRLLCWILIGYRFCKNLMLLIQWNSNNSVIDDDDEEMGSQSDLGLHNLRHFVLYLEGEEELVSQMVKDNRHAIDHWITKGKKPKNLLIFLEKSPCVQDLKGVYEFDSDQVPSLHARERPNCWALPIVTLTSIAIALPGIDHCSIKQLIRSVNEGLPYVRLIQKNLNDGKEFVNVKRAADILWLKVDLYHKWIDIDLRERSLQNKSLHKILEELASIAKHKYLKLKVDISEGDDPSRWPIEVLAANSMYRISQTILLDNLESAEKLFEKLSTMITDIFKACFTNLPKVIPIECNRSTIEEREESVRRTIVLLGEVDEILEILDQETAPNLDQEKLGYIDEWRLMIKEEISQELSSSVGDKAVNTPSDISVHG